MLGLDFMGLKMSYNARHAAMQSLSAMKWLSTWSLMRNIAPSFFLTRPTLCEPGMALMQKVANSKSPLLNPDLNPLLRTIIKPLIYDQFCAGTNKPEIRQMNREIETLSFAGIVLCYAKETPLNQKNACSGARDSHDTDIQKWLDGNLKTLDMIPSGNWLGTKYVNIEESTPET